MPLWSQWSWQACRLVVMPKAGFGRLVKLGCDLLVVAFFNEMFRWAHTAPVDSFKNIYIYIYRVVLQIIT